MTEITFENWIELHAAEITQAQAYAKSDLPDNPAMIHADLNTCTRISPSVGDMLADVTHLITKCRAKETLDVKSDPKFADWTGPEKKIEVDSRLARIIRVRDILETTASALKERHWSLVGMRSYEREALRLSPHQ